MNHADSVPAVLRFAVEVDDAARISLDQRLRDAGIPASVGWDLGERGPLGGRVGPMAVISLMEDLAAAGASAVTRVGIAARDWLRSASFPPNDGVYLEIVDHRTQVTVRIRASDSGQALQLIPEVLRGRPRDTPVGWNGHEWGDELPDREPAPARASAGGQVPVRILALDTEWFSAHGGITTFNRHLCAALAKAGAQVFCVVLTVSPEARADAAKANVELVEAVATPGGSERAALMRRPALSAGVIPDVIIGHSRVTGPAAKSLAEDHYPNAARLHFVHTAPDEAEWPKLDRSDDAGERAESRMQEELELGRGATRVVAVGPRLYDLFERELHKFPGTPAPLRLDPGFDVADPGLRTPPPGKLRQILLTARLEDKEVKGLDIAAKAIANAVGLIGADASQVELLLRGTPPGQLTTMRDAALAWAGRRCFRVTPRSYVTDADQLQQDLHGATVAIMPSRAEGFGLAGLEAIVAGTPVLVSSTSGLGMLLSEVAPDLAANVVIPLKDNEQEDVSRWGHEIASVLQDPAAAFTRAEKLRRRMAKKRTWAMAAALVLNAAQPTRDQLNR